MCADRHLFVDALHLRLGDFRLENIELVAGRGEYHILLGPSGSGKSSLMKSILGFYRILRGSVWHRGEEITHRLPESRRMGYVPQNYALFPHLDVEHNIRFGMKAARMSTSEADVEVNKLLGILGINHMRRRNVTNLSGGERQKVALARALGTRPETILLDEPFSSIDEGGKRGLWFELRSVIEEVGITTLHITHNLEEAETLGDRISVIHGGRLLQTGTREDIFKKPASEPVARFLNYRNIFRGIARPEGEGSTVEVGGFTLWVARRLPAMQKAVLCIRQHDIKIIKDGIPVKQQLRQNVFNGEVIKLFNLLDSCLMWFKVDGSKRGHDFELRFPRHIRERFHLEVGHRVQVGIWEPKIICLK